MPGGGGGWVLGDVLLVSGLIGVQVVYAVYMVFLDRVLALGLQPLSVIVLANLTASAFLLPFALVFEKKKWPRTLSGILILQFVAIAFGGVALFQALLLLGVKKTTPAIASAMPNLAPGFILIISACLGFEKVKKRCKYTWTKIFGTLFCLSGAIAMSFLQNATTSRILLYQVPFDGSIEQEWIKGCGYLISAVVLLSCSTVLQAITMQNFPAPFSLCIITSTMGAIFTAIVEIITEGKLDIGSSTISLTSIIGVVLLGGAVSSICVAYQTWCLNKKGPVLVSMFNPIQSISSAILSALILGQVISIGSMAGMLLMFVGLYMVLWAKKKESCSVFNNDDSVSDPGYDVEKPLLS